MVSDAPQDLRQCAYSIGQHYPVTADVCRQSADYIERLEQQLAALSKRNEELVNICCMYDVPEEALLNDGGE